MDAQCASEKLQTQPTMSSQASAQHRIDRDALMRVVEPIAFAHGVEVLDIEFRPESHGWVLRVYVEKKGASAAALSSRDAAVGLEVCTGVSRDLSPALDVADVVPQAYRLEVSSPGLERPLRGEQDFVRFAGNKAKIKLRAPVPGASPRVVVGVLGGINDARLQLREGEQTHEIPLSSIESARLVFEFGSHPRTGLGAREAQQRKH